MIVDSRGGIMRGPLRWTGPTGLSELNVRRDRNARSVRRDRNVRKDLNGLVITSSEIAAGSDEATASRDLLGVVVLSG